MVKRGVKAKYIEFGNEPVQDVVGGHLLGISLNHSTKNYYTMIPKALLPKSEKRSKRKWLGSDLQIAVAKFRALINELRGQQETTISTTVLNEDIVQLVKLADNRKPANSVQNIRHNLELYAKDDAIKLIETGKSIAEVSESHYIECLKKELQNPKSLAKKRCKSS